MLSHVINFMEDPGFPGVTLIERYVGLGAFILLVFWVIRTFDKRGGQLVISIDTLNTNIVKLVERQDANDKAKTAQIDTNTQRIISILERLEREVDELKKTRPS